MGGFLHKVGFLKGVLFFHKCFCLCFFMFFFLFLCGLFLLVSFWEAEWVMEVNRCSFFKSGFRKKVFF